MSNRKFPKVIIFSGAGLSAESGIPTFSGDNGAYSALGNPEEFISKDNLKRNPEALHRFCDDFRVTLKDKVPNEGHRAIARLAERYPGQVIHLTQNIDDLTERAGYEGSIHLHGRLTHMRDPGNPRFYVDIGHTRYWDGKPDEAPAQGFQFRRKNTYRYRPDVVLFGELAPEYARLYSTFNKLTSRDTVIVVGTEGAVVPIGMLVIGKPGFKILINPKSSDHIDDRFFDVILRENASTGMPKAEEIIAERMEVLREISSSRETGSAFR